MQLATLELVVLLLGLSVLAVALMRRVHMPAILGYLAVGVVAGPASLGWLPDTDVIRLLAEVGVAFLLFSIGLEFSWTQLVALRRAVFGLGAAQVVLTTAAFGALFWAMELSWEGALVGGGALALSSTAIATKQLGEQLEMQSRHGRLALAVLLFQDLAVVPFLVVIPILAGDGSNALGLSLLIALLKGGLAFGLMLVIGHYALRPVFHLIARTDSPELFTMTVLLVSLSAATVTHLAGLSFALGAFLAGMMLGETEYRHQIEVDIRPFRDVLMALFFVTIGFQLDLHRVPGLWLEIALLLVFLIVLKAIIILALVRVAGYETAVALRTGLVLAQAGEFSFALIALAVHQNVFSAAHSQAMLAAAVISMALAPLLIRWNGPIAKTLFARTYLTNRRQRAQQIGQASGELSEHVILCGFGRIGQNIAQFLRQENIAYVALDLDPLLIREAWDAGERVFYGDVTHVDILEAAGIERARVLVVTFDDPRRALRVVRLARQRKADLPIVVRTRDDAFLEQLETAGATSVVPETVEASMLLASSLLQRLGVPLDEVARVVEKARADHYHDLRGYFGGQEGAAGGTSNELHTVVLSPQAHGVGRRLGELQLARCGVRVLSLRRGEIRGEMPGEATVLREGDALVLEGVSRALVRAEARLLRGA
jgi:CPA2 family monovalent cation:H+ antiporter-2